MGIKVRATSATDSSLLKQDTEQRCDSLFRHLGLIIVPLGYADPSLFKAGTPYGASTVSGQENNPPTPDDTEVARFQGKRVAQVARALKKVGETATKQEVVPKIPPIFS